MGGGAATFWWCFMISHRQRPPPSRLGGALLSGGIMSGIPCPPNYTCFFVLFLVGIFWLNRPLLVIIWYDLSPTNNLSIRFIFIKFSCHVPNKKVPCLPWKRSILPLDTSPLACIAPTTCKQGNGWISLAFIII